nr:hypothetical protein [Woeseiaceae bacterium]
MGIEQHLEGLPAEATGVVEHGLERLGDGVAQLSSDEASRLVRVLAASDFAASTLARLADELPDLIPVLDAPLDFESLAERADDIAAGGGELDDVKSALR